MKKIKTKITEAKNNGGMHDLKGYKKAKAMIEDHAYKQARLYHLCLSGSTQIEPYKTAVKSLMERLRDHDAPAQYKAALEEDEGKELHMHVFILVEAAKFNPDHIINRKAGGWLDTMTLKKGITFDINAPRSPIHNPPDKPSYNYASVPKTKLDKINDCIEWISYLYKTRSKPNIRQIYFSSRPARALIDA
jgi:hypothetical protein